MKIGPKGGTEGWIARSHLFVLSTWAAMAVLADRKYTTNKKKGETWAVGRGVPYSCKGTFCTTHAQVFSIRAEFRLRHVVRAFKLSLFLRTNFKTAVQSTSKLIWNQKGGFFFPTLLSVKFLIKTKPKNKQLTKQKQANKQTKNTKQKITKNTTTKNPKQTKKQQSNNPKPKQCDWSGASMR